MAHLFRFFLYRQMVTRMAREEQRSDSRTRVRAPSPEKAYRQFEDHLPI
jgi:hypothetical protein